MKKGNLEVYGIIYKIRNRVNNKHYIGQTIQGFERRYCYEGHGIERVYKSNLKFKNSGKNYNTYLLRSIEKYGFNAFEVIEIFDIAFSKEELDIKEDIWINYFDCIKNGYNNQGGGSNGKPSQETIEKRRKAIVGHPNWNTNPFSKETRMKISKNNKGKTRSEDAKQKISIARKGMKFSEEHKENLKEIRQNPEHNASKKVICLNNLEIFDSVSFASKQYKTTKIGECCNGRRRSAGSVGGEKLAWMYYNDYLNTNELEILQKIKYANEIPTQKYPNKEIICLDTLCRYNSLIEAEKHTGISSSCIGYCCNGKTKTAGKLRWMFYEEYIKLEQVI